MTKFTFRKSVSSKKPLYFIEKDGKYQGFSRSKRQAASRVKRLNLKGAKKL